MILYTASGRFVFTLIKILAHSGKSLERRVDLGGHLKLLYIEGRSLTSTGARDDDATSEI